MNTLSNKALILQSIKNSLLIQVSKGLITASQAIKELDSYINNQYTEGVI